MLISATCRRISRVFYLSGSLYSDLNISSNVEDFSSRHRFTQTKRFSILQPLLQYSTTGAHVRSSNSILQLGPQSLCFKMTKAFLTSEASTITEGSTETVKELYLKMLKSVEAKTMPPNAWLWSLIENCANREDIKLLFEMLQKLRRFRLSNLRIHSNFNCHLCHTVAKACARVGALDYGKKALWKNNVYGLTPSVSSAQCLLLYAKEHNNVKQMVQIMKLLKRNSLPLQPGIADIVFSICYNTDNWDLISNYSKRFIKNGVKLRRTAFGIWMEFAAKRGDVQSIWDIEALRAKTIQKHNIASALSCAKGYLLERKPGDAATFIHMFIQCLPDSKKPGAVVELQKLVKEWPLEVIKRQKKDRKKLASFLKSDLHAMVGNLLSMGLVVTINMEDIMKETVSS